MFHSPLHLAGMRKNMPECLSADAQVLGRQGILQAADLHACVELVAGRGGHVAEVSSARTHTARTLRLKEHGLRDGKLRGC